jgi:type VI secretion system protein ImpF
MAEPAESERLQPSLLDRLTDSAPTEVTESVRERVIDMRRLREIVLRDLTWLLNTVNTESSHDLERHPNVASSTINYGITDISGKRAIDARPFELERRIKTAIETFEPRIIKGTLSVSLGTNDNGAQSHIEFNVRADLWAQPVPTEVFLRTELDVTTGEMRIERS